MAALMSAELTGRVRLAGLPSGDRRVAQFAIAALVAAAATVVAHGTGLVSLPVSQIQGATVQPTAALVALVGLGAGGAALVTGALRPGGPPPGLTLPAVAIVLAAIAGTLLRNGSTLDVYREVVIGRSLVPPWLTTLIRAAGWVSFACAAGILAMAVARRVRCRSLAVLLVVLPPALLVVLLALVAWLADYPDLVKDAGAPEPTAWFLSGTALILSQVSAALIGLAVWQVIAGVGATRKLAARGAPRIARRRRLAFGLLGAKVLWLTLGLCGVLWPILGGDSPKWEATREDGLIAWLLAVAVAALAACWLVRGRRAVRGRTLAPVAWVLSLAIVWPAVAASVAILAIAVVTSNAGPDTAMTVADVAAWLADRFLAAPRYAIAGAAAVAVGMVLTKRLRSWTVLLGLFATWSTPSLIASYADHRVSYTVGASTLDVALTAVLGATLIWAYRTGHTRLSSSIVLALLVSAVVGWGGTISSSAIGPAATAHLTLLFPIVWIFLLDAPALNAPSPERLGRLLQALGLAAVTLAIAAYQLTVRPVDAAGFDEVVRVLLAPALAASLIAATVTAWRPRESKMAP